MPFDSEKSERMVSLDKNGVYGQNERESHQDLEPKYNQRAWSLVEASILIAEY